MKIPVSVEKTTSCPTLTVAPVTLEANLESRGTYLHYSKSIPIYLSSNNCAVNSGADWNVISIKTVKREEQKNDRNAR